MSKRGPSIFKLAEDTRKERKVCRFAKRYVCSTWYQTGTLHICQKHPTDTVYLCSRHKAKKKTKCKQSVYVRATETLKLNQISFKDLLFSKKSWATMTHTKKKPSVRKKRRK